MPANGAVIDACVLFKSAPRDLLLRCAEARLYRPYWSDEILGEVERNDRKRRERGLRRKGDTVDPHAVAEEQTGRLMAAIRRAFPEALVIGPVFEHSLTMATNHPKDRHVLAAAIAAGAHIIVTDNLKDFPPDALAPFHIEALSADRFLCDLFDSNRDLVLTVARQRAEEFTKPPGTMEQMIDRLGTELPEFAGRLRALHATQSASAHDLEAGSSGR